MSEVADALRLSIERCEKVTDGELLPHQVDAWELWETLSRSSDSLSGTEEHLLYASLLKLIIGLVRIQCRWLRYEASELYVDSDIAREKINSLSMRRLNSIFLKSFHPLVELEELTSRALKMGRDHWENLPEGDFEEETSPEPFMTYGAGSEQGRLVLEKKRFEELLGDLERELGAEFEGNGSEVPYGHFISRGGSASFAEMVSRGYLASFLVSRGSIGLAGNGGDLRIVRGNGEGVGRTRSLAVIFRRPREA